ncbi:MAG: ATP-binding protein [Pseudomonadota bacterium]|nr:ATP-binding protein [Pseudomonadota bacterium]
MKFAKKLAIALWLGILAIYMINGFDRYRREADLFETDMERDHSVMGRGLGAAVSEIWEAQGQGAALELVDRANQRESEILIRWVRVGAPPEDPVAPRGPAALLVVVAEGQTVNWVDGEGEARLYSYVPLRVNGAWNGAIELSESLAAEQTYLRASMARVAVTSAALAVMSGVIAMALGAWFVGRPIRLLAEKARRVGAGDFAGDLVLQQNDELGELAMEMNAMSRELAAARELLELETTARINALEQLRHAERVTTVGKLASGVAHELGTPLNVISHRAKLVATGRAEGESARENGRIVFEQCERIARIVRQLLDYTRTGVPAMREQEVAPLVDRSLAFLDPLLRTQNVIVVRERTDATARAAVDGPRLEQVITNLAMNAIQAMPNGGTLMVRVERVPPKTPPEDGEPERGWVCIRLADTGTGIARETLPLIFDPFFTTKDVGEGTGLGLSVAWGIAREHGGFILVQSVLGHGSAFTVHVPAVGP